MIGGIMFGMHSDFILWPGPLLVRTAGVMPWLGRADGGCSQFVPDYSFRRKWDSSDGELEHPVLLQRKILPEKILFVTSSQCTAPVTPALSTASLWSEGKWKGME